MPVIIKANKNDSTNDIIKRFKKVVAANKIVQIVKDRRYYKKPSRRKSEKIAELHRLKKRLRKLKRMKNISQATLKKIVEKINALS